MRFWKAARTCSAVTPGGRVIVRPLGVVNVAPPPPVPVCPFPLSPGAMLSRGARRGVGAVASRCSTRSGSRPSTLAAEPTSRCVRSAALGTASTPWRCPVWTLTSVFIPGLSRCPGFGMPTSTVNIVAFWTTWACGLIFTTTPANGWFGNASTVIVAGIPGCTLPTSVSLTSAESCTASRFAIFRMTVPPPSVGLEITVPSTASISRMVPVIGERT